LRSSISSQLYSKWGIWRAIQENRKNAKKSYVIDITLEFVILLPDGAFVITNVPDKKSNVADNSRCSLRGPAANPGPWRDAPCETAAAYLMYIPIGYTLDKTMATSTVFTSNRSQAVRLPKAVAFPPGVHQVDILKIGRSRLIVPQGKRWDDLFQNGPRASDDFMAEREQPQAEEREPL
jgi:antitoxin VapB